MTGVYQFFYLETVIGQSPLRSDSVFNFFSSDFVRQTRRPEHFISNNLVAPEFKKANPKRYHPHQVS